MKEAVSRLPTRGKLHKSLLNWLRRGEQRTKNLEWGHGPWGTVGIEELGYSEISKTVRPEGRMCPQEHQDGVRVLSGDPP